MTDHDGTEARRESPQDGDPLLVRPYLNDGFGVPPAASAETWPAATTRPTRRPPAHRAAPIALPGGPAAAAVPGRRSRWRSLAVAGAGAALVIALAAAGFAAFAPDDNDTDGQGALPVAPPPASAGILAPPTAASATTSPSAAIDAPASPRATTGGAPAADRTPASHPSSRPTAGPSRAGPTPRGPALAPRSPAPTLSAPPAADRVGVIRAGGNLCLDLNGGVPADDNHVQVFECNNTVAQRWTLAADGTLRVVGRCAQVTADATVHIIGCDTRPAAQWRAGAGKALVNLATNTCLTDPSNGTRSAAGVLVAACAGAPGQQWTLP
jgi:ricin-type beta-trefoil lectin protein